jgi:hypothetical protein
MARLIVCNSSYNWRRGPVTIAWDHFYEKVKIEPDRLQLIQDSGIRLPFQIDQIDPDDPSSKVLIFTLQNWIEPIPDKDSTSELHITAGEGQSPQGTELKLDITGRGVKLINSRLEVWFNLDPVLDYQDKPFYAGCATSVQLDRKEMLDTFFDHQNHDPRKRCMQLDHIELADSNVKVKIDQYYRIVNYNVGPVRAILTIASQPFDFARIDPTTQENRQLKCCLYRVISLYAGADFIIEDLFIKPVIEEQAVPEDFDLPYFTAHYFSYFAYVSYPELNISRFKHVPDWFVLNNLTRPFQAYGFASDRHVAGLRSPHPDFPDSENKYRSLSWSLYSCQYARVLHLFLRYQPSDTGFGTGTASDHSEGQPKGLEGFSLYEQQKGREAKQYFEDRTGQAWNEFIYQPLWARMAD